MRQFLFIFTMTLSASLMAQNVVSGEVSYASGTSIYVRFDNTSGISVGDTLSVAGSPCLVVLYRSSISVVTESFGGCEVSMGSGVQAKLEEQVDSEDSEDHEDHSGQEEPDPQEEPESQEELEDEGREGLRVRGSASLASYNVVSMDGFYTGYSRNVARINFDVENLGVEGLDLELNGNYQQFDYFNRESETPASEGRFNIYNSALRWEKPLNEEGSTALRVSLGRFTNRNAASIGPVDGVSSEFEFNQFFVGALVGSRPDFETFGVNPSLLQYGVYGGGLYNTKSTQHQSTLGWMQQTNSGEIDRQYLYVQHATSIGGKLNLFASSEIDLYENFDTAAASQAFKLSSLYLSANYRFHPKWNLFLSYDSRQQIIFFQQYDSEIERLLDESGIQQGYRARIRYNPNRNWSFALGYHRRVRSNNDGFGQNAQLYLAYRNLPWIGGSLSLQGNANLSRYLQSEIGSIRYSRTLMNRKLSFQLYSRYLQYHYVNRELAVNPEWYYGTEWQYRFGNDWSLGILAEYSMQKEQDVMRGNIRLIKRF